MLTATFTAGTLHAAEPTSATGPVSSRTISGTALPWDQVGTVTDGTRVRFARGALSADPDALPVVLRDHDRTRPLGRVAAARDTGAGVEVDVRVSATRDGDEALILAADGVLGMFSVGVNPTDHHVDGDGVLVVTAGEWVELSLLTFGAFAGARVTRVAAEAGADPPRLEPAGAPQPGTDPDEDVPPADPDEDEDEDEDDEDHDDQEDTAMSTRPNAPAVVPIAAAAPRPARDLDLRGLAGIYAGAAAQGLSADDTRARIRAALTDVTTTNVAGVVQPAYLSEVRGLIVRARATIDAISSAPLPAGGMTLEYPQWTDLPDVDLQPAEKTAIPTGAVTIGLGSTPVLTWATGNDISLQTVQRSSPSFMDAYLRAAAASYARKTNAYVGAQLLATATDVPPGATPTFIGSIGALLGALSPATTPPGQVFVGMSWDIGVAMFGVTANNGPAFWSGTINLGGGAGSEASMSAAGMNLYVDWDLPALTMLAGTRPAATWVEDPSSPADVRVVDVSLLGVDVGVYGFGALIIEYPDAFAKTTFVTPPTGTVTGGGAGEETAARSTRSSR